MITIDAQDQTLGRIASAAAKALLGKHTASFARNVVVDEEVKIVNASKVRVSGNKKEAMKYLRYSGYPGGQQIENYAMLTGRLGHSEAVRRAVKGMLPKNKLQTPRLKKLIIEG